MCQKSLKDAAILYRGQFRASDKAISGRPTVEPWCQQQERERLSEGLRSGQYCFLRQVPWGERRWCGRESGEVVPWEVAES